MYLSTLLLILAVSSTESLPTGCPENQWQCTGGTCIAISARCDNIPDCIDGSDEVKCTISPVCLEGLESCPQPNGTTVCVKKAIGCGCGKVPDIDHGNVIATTDLIGSMANVTCEAGFQSSKQFITCQKTGLWETASCISKDCGPVNKIAYGKISLADINNTTYGVVGLVPCNVGYDTLTANVTCQENGTWSTAVCSVIGCGLPPDINHGTIKSNGKETLGSSAELVCNVGYEASNKTVACQMSGEWEYVECLPIDCGLVPEIPFGKINLNGYSNTTYGSSASVTCDTGFETNQTNIICQTSGEWQTTICIPKDCGPINGIAFGTIQLAVKDNTSYGASGIVTCNEGYETLTPHVSCGEDGVWTTAICSLKDCGYPPDIAFGNISLHNNSITTIGATASVTCVSPNVPSKTTVTCMTSGQWEAVSCGDFSGCGAPYNIAHGKINSIKTNSYRLIAELACDIGYIANKSTVSCQMSGAWERVDCLPIDCGHLPTIPFGKISINGTSTYGSTATVTCNVGYETNQTQIFCQASGEWQTSKCLAIDCGTIPSISSGKIILMDPNNTTYGATASVVCDDGFYTDMATVLCLGRWQTAYCKAKDCRQLPAVKYGTVNLADANNTTYGAIAHITCNRGFESKRSTIKCTSTGLWQTAICEARDCGPPPVISNGKLRLINYKTAYGSKAIVECRSKFTPNVPYVECLANGHWGDAKCLGPSNKDRCTEEHGVCTRYIYENVRLLALKSSKCKSFCQCIHAGTSAGGIITYTWAEHRCPPRTLFDDNLYSPVCNHQFMVNC